MQYIFMLRLVVDYGRAEHEGSGALSIVIPTTHRNHPVYASSFIILYMYPDTLKFRAG